MEVPQRNLETFQLCSVVGEEEEETTSAAFCVIASMFFFSVHIKPWTVFPQTVKITFNFIKGFRNKGLDGFKAFNYKSQCGELAAAIADQLIC